LAGGERWRVATEKAVDKANWTTRWEVQRDMMGTPGSARRKAVDAFLQSRPCLMYWGDSWFSTPLYLNLAKQSMLRINGMAMLVGKPGATAAGLFTAGQIRNYADRLKSNPFDALCLSAGGNDELSQRLQAMFAPWSTSNPPARLTAQQAFARVLDSRTLDRVRDRYTAVLDGLGPVVRKRKDFRVIGHTYALLERIGQPADLTTGNIGLIAWVKDDVGPWLWPTMKRVLGSKDEAKAFSHLLLRDGFRDRVLVPLRQAHAGLFSFADFTGTPEAATDAFWNDEIHPTQDGFAVLARQFNRQIRSVLPAAKQGAVT
jgi:hypothetical protein